MFDRIWRPTISGRTRITCAMDHTTGLRRRDMLSAALALAVAAPMRRAGAAEKDLLVFAAASLKTALDAADAPYQKDRGAHVVVSFAASSALAKQIEAGAPADIFISADPDWMDYLEKRNLIKAGTRTNLAGNALVLIAPKDSKEDIAIAPGFPLLQALGADGRLAMADPAAVPAGLYGKAALEKLGVWARVAPRVAPAENVRAALALVSRGEAPLGIVYRTDAAADTGVRIVATFPPDTHPPIIYPIAVVATSTHPAAAAYLAYLTSPAARPFLDAQGFTPPP
jgi:molybdate transport system substrate-binding protein